MYCHFFFIKIVTQKQLYQQQVRLVAHTFLACFSVYKNRDTKVIILAARLYIRVFVLSIVKIIS